MLCKTGRGRCTGFHLFPCSTSHLELRTTQEDEVILIAPWWPFQPWFPHLLRLCLDHTPINLYLGTYSHNKGMSRIASRTICTLGGSHAALPSSRIFKEVFRLATAPRRPSTNRPYDDRWVCFTHWAAFCIIALILMACHLKLSKDTGPA